MSSDEKTRILPQVAEATVGTQLSGIYELDERIAFGGMGEVYRGHNIQTGDPVAIKIVLPELARDPTILSLFRKEASILNHLAHDAIVRYHVFTIDAGIGRPYLAMEFVDGDTLADVIARHVARAALAGPSVLPGMPFLRAWSYFQQLLGALASTHALGIVHLDVKPSNVLIRRDGLVKLTDFGIARQSSTPVSASVSTLAPGTGVYMSPEQVLGQTVDARSDLYSAATVLYEMLSGRTPFLSDGRGELAIRQDQVYATPPSIRRFLPQAPLVVEALFARALSKSPLDRFTSAIEMGDAFREALGIADTPAWRAQAEMADLAAQAERERTKGQSANRMGTLRDFLVKKYRTEPIKAQNN